MDILDMILGAEMANEYTDNQRLAHEEKTVITWDGNTEGKASVTAGENGMMYKVSDDPIVITEYNLKSIADDRNVVPGEGLVVMSQVSENGATMTIISVRGLEEYGPVVMVTDKDAYMDGVLIAEKGVYFNKSVSGYVNRLELETVHQIDQKFIPEAPVFTPTTEIPYGGSPANLTKEEGEELYRLAQKHDVIRVFYKGQYITATRYYDTGEVSGASEAWCYYGIYLGATGAYPSMKVLMLVCEPSFEHCMAMEAPLAVYVAYDLQGMEASTTET